MTEEKAGPKVELTEMEQSLALMGAIRRNDEARLKKLLALGVNPDSEALGSDLEGLGTTLLAEGAKSMSLGCLSALLEAGADPNYESVEEEPPLVALAWSGSDESVAKIEALLRAGANPNARSLDSTSALERAIGKFCFSSSGGQGEAMAMIQALLSGGSDPNASASDGGSLLKKACKYESVEAVKALLAAGADPRVADERGRSPLTFMQSQGSSAPSHEIRRLLTAEAERLDLDSATRAGKPGAPFRM